MKKHHKIILGGFGTLIVVALIVMGILINGIIIKQTIEKNSLEKQIQKLETDTNNKINELAINVIDNNKNLQSKLVGVNKKINLLKASTKKDFSGIINQTIASVVIIQTLSSQGTGFFISGNGYLVTNIHVLVNKDGQISKIIQITTDDGKTHLANFIGGVKDLDLALLKIGENYPPLQLANSSKIKVGEKVIAIGNPQGYKFSVTEGIISAVQRKGSNGYNIYIQTSADLNPGNSGGPLIDSRGKVVGMNNFKLMNSEGMGFALESNVIGKIANIIAQKQLNQTLI